MSTIKDLSSPLSQAGISCLQLQPFARSCGATLLEYYGLA